MFRVQVLGVQGLVNDILEGQKCDHGGGPKMAGWGETWTSFWRAAQKKAKIQHWVKPDILKITTSSSITSSVSNK